MTDQPFSLTYIQRLIDRFLSLEGWEELKQTDETPWMSLSLVDGAEGSAGFVRVWRGPENTELDRMVHMRLIAGPVETQLLFVFGRSTTSLPHLHAQIVQFPPDGCVYNMDYLPRLDPVEFPGWFGKVFSDLRRPYRKATADSSNSCAQAPANPALAAYMSPWGIASGRSNLEELEKVWDSLEAYVDHYLELVGQSDWQECSGDALSNRDRKHLEIFFADEMDPRAWNGVYKIIGEEPGKAIKAAFATPLRD